MTFFFDRTYGRKVPQALKILGLAVEAHDSHFMPHTKDDQWLAAVGQSGWAVITHDKRMLYNQSERRAIVHYGVGCFVVPGAELSKWERVRILARAWDTIQALAANEARPFIYRLYADGRSRRLYP